MSVRFASVVMAMAALPLLAACGTSEATAQATSTPSPYTAKALASACKGRDGWNDPAPPAQI